MNIQKIFLVIGVAWIFLLTGMAMAAVGQVPDNPLEPYPSYMPFLIFFVVVVPFVCGYMAGRQE